MDVFQSYQEEFARDSEIDDTNLDAVTMRHSSNRQKWYSRLNQLKYDVYRLEKAKTDKINSSFTDNSEIRLSTTANKSTAGKIPEIQKIDEKVNEIKMIIQLVSDICLCMNNMGFDIKNRIEAIKINQN